jgi:membrane protein DedA with SNARE-associated domain
MVDLEHAIEAYGYYAIFVGAFFEGETILVLGALAAHRGYLSLAWVMIVAGSGSLFGDQLWFYLARRFGHRFLEKRPAWRVKTQRALTLLEKYNTLFILTFRFMYGLRSVSSFAIGLTGVAIPRFVVLNTLGAVVWAIGLGGAGYLIGEAFKVFMERVGHYELPLFAGIAAIGFGLWLYRTLRDRSRAKAALQTQESPQPQNVEMK